MICISCLAVNLLILLRQSLAAILLSNLSTILGCGRTQYINMHDNGNQGYSLWRYV